ncbi:MAG: hypothetical protein PUK31_01555 [Candidatus Methanomethylophilaceae archaeon]|nr:hypothetical protein [Candidatus Methanomethylophilaceae archaeon]MDY5872142.1 hypothetical protein [Candidatus Methanomethylophilaceae archaeon]
MKQNTAFMRRRLNKNKKGGIEGLPLQLLIIIVIASIGLATMVGWMNSIEEPSTIDDAKVTVKKMSNSYYDVTVTAYDNNGNVIEGADVVVSGLGAKAYTYSSSAYNGSTGNVPAGKTLSSGTVTLKITLNNLDDYGYLNVEISKPGMSTYKTTVLVTK